MRIRLTVIRYFLFWAATLVCLAAQGQYYQFSQYNFADQRVNPAFVAATDEASLNFLFRNQQTGGPYAISTSFLSAAYPLLTMQGKRWSGIGLSLSDDRTGGVFSTQEASVSYAANVFLSRFQSISLGIKGLYMQRRIDLDGLVTGMQYVTDRGFNEGIYNGESLGDLNTRMFTLSLGGLWQQVDRNKSQVASLGFSFFDFNRPEDSFLDEDTHLRGTFVGHAALRVLNRGPLSLRTDMLVTSGYANTVVNTGLVTSYELRQGRNVNARIDVISRYVVGRSGILGFQVHKENFSVGISYDFPLVVTNYGNTGALEFGISLHRIVNPRARQQAKRRKEMDAARARPKPASSATVMKDSVTSTPDSVKTLPVKTNPSVTESILLRRDSVKASGFAGNIKHEPVVLERAQLHFNFGFNSASLDGESLQYLREIASVLKEDENLTVSLTGHTDNVGSQSYNLKLSLKRASAVRDFLLDAGVQPDRVTVAGKGMSEPLNSNETEEQSAQNRRVEIQILYGQ